MTAMIHKLHISEDSAQLQLIIHMFTNSQKDSTHEQTSIQRVFTTQIHQTQSIQIYSKDSTFTNKFDSFPVQFTLQTLQFQHDHQASEFLKSPHSNHHKFTQDKISIHTIIVQHRKQQTRASSMFTISSIRVQISSYSRQIQHPSQHEQRFTKFKTSMIQIRQE